jgi:hypothetical protein
VSVEFRDYRFQGDKLDCGSGPGQPDASQVCMLPASSAKHGSRQLEVRFGTLTDGTTYPAEALLEAKAKKLSVVVTNSGIASRGASVTADARSGAPLGHRSRGSANLLLITVQHRSVSLHT